MVWVFPFYSTGPKRVIHSYWAVAEFNNSSAKLSKNAATLFAQKVQRELSKQEPPTIEQVLAMQDHCRSIGMDHRYIGSSPVYREICNLPAKADAQEKPKENATNLVLREVLELLVQDRREADELFKRFDDWRHGTVGYASLVGRVWVGLRGLTWDGYLMVLVVLFGTAI